VPDFLDQKREEIDKRLAELEPLIAEYNRLRAAAAALSAVDGQYETVSAPDMVAGRERRSGPVGGERARVASAVTDEPENRGEPEETEPLTPAVSSDTTGPTLQPTSAEASGLVAPQGVASISATSLQTQNDRPASPPSATPSPVRRAGRPKGSGTRAAEALRIVREHPGVTIPELADRMGIKQNYLYRVLPELVQQGKVSKQGRGWHPQAG
jgi:hypothetical protein